MTAATSKIERYVIIVNAFQMLTIITQHFILDVAAILDPPLAPVPSKISLHSCKRLLSLYLKSELVNAEICSYLVG